MSDFVWLIEAPGPCYLAARKLGGYNFHWTPDANKALRFHDQIQADLTMRAIRELSSELFSFEVPLGNAHAVEHGFLEDVFIHLTPKVDDCKHNFKGYREFADGKGGEAVCTKCGMGAMEYTMRVGP